MSQLGDNSWLVFGAGFTDDEARARFEQRFGSAAERVVRENGLVWVGPVVKAAELEPATE